MKEGDFIEIEYVGRVKLTNEIFDLTSEELAKKEGIHNPKHTYGPALVVIGSNMVIRGVMKELERMEVGEERMFDVDPSEGFGMRSPKLIKIISVSKFIENKINPIPGEYFEIDGMQAKVQSVSGGRVRVDFNNPLAGKMLTYKVKILKRIEKYYRVDYSGLEIRGKGIVVKSEKPVNPVAKKFVIDMITKWLKGTGKVDFREKGTGKKDVKD
jgi:FKBP-type peptidyl-prolyl cis-trans isomerase 2